MKGSKSEESIVNFNLLFLILHIFHFITDFSHYCFLCRSLCFRTDTLYFYSKTHRQCPYGMSNLQSLHLTSTSTPEKLQVSLLASHRIVPHIYTDFVCEDTLLGVPYMGKGVLLLCNPSRSGPYERGRERWHSEGTNPGFFLSGPALRLHPVHCTCFPYI